MVRRIFVPTKQEEEESGEDGMVKELHALYFSPDVIRPKQAWWMRWKKHVERRRGQKFAWNCHLKTTGKELSQGRGTNA